MKSDEATVTLYALHTAEGLAKACRDFADHGWPRCPVGFYFQCPLIRLGDGRCGKIEAKDWEAVMVEPPCESSICEGDNVRTEIRGREFVGVVDEIVTEKSVKIDIGEGCCVVVKPEDVTFIDRAG